MLVALLLLQATRLRAQEPLPAPTAEPAGVEAGAGAAGEAAGPESAWRWALAISDEVSVRTGLAERDVANIALVQPSLGWRHGDRARVVSALSGLLVSDPGGSTFRLRVRETYAGITAGDVDLALGKKVLRWSNGFAFTPAGVLDPPRRPTDPTDRLNLNEGRGIALASLVHGRHAFTAAWASAGIVERRRPGLREVTALRYGALVHGIDAALVAAYRRGLGPFAAATFTAIAASRFELHGEVALGIGADVLVLPGGVALPLDDRRRLSALVGTRTTLPGGLTAIAEFYTADGLIPPGDAAAGAIGAGGPVPTERRNYAFFHLGKARLAERPGWRDWDLGLVTLLGLSDAGAIFVLDVERRVGGRLALHGRLQVPRGPAGTSEYGMIPWTSEASLSLRFSL